MYSDSPSLASSAVADVLPRVVQRVPPLYPLRQWVAVNPFVGYSEEPFATAVRDLAGGLGARLLMSTDYYREAWRKGEITERDLHLAQQQLGSHVSTGALQEYLLQGEARVELAPIVARFLDERDPRPAWDAALTHTVSTFCAGYFDEDQATWGFPWRDLPLFAAWRESAQHDQSLVLKGLSGLPEFIAQLPQDPAHVLETWIPRLRPTSVPTEVFLLAQLGPLWGWAGHLQYLDREEQLRGGPGQHRVQQLLAIRVALAAALFQETIADTPLAKEWEQQTWSALPESSLRLGQIWQTAYEIAWQRTTLARLAPGPASAEDRPAPVQAVFCIDVRSERLRRHLEAAWPGELETFGFAGFFGAATQYQDPASGRWGNRGPALFAPSLLTTAEGDHRDEQQHFAEERAWSAFKNASVSCFTYVESFGLASVASLLRGRAPAKPSCRSVPPSIAELPLAQRVALAEGMLKGLSWAKRLGEVILLCGHGADSANNPQLAGLQCGACGGHAGDQNALLACAVLNDPAVRVELAERGQGIPAHTVFLAALHETVTDQITVLNQPALTPRQADLLQRFHTAAEKAGRATEQERLALMPEARSGKERSVDISETRPEAGLANNAAVIFAPRSWTKGVHLDGRVFLHDYRAEEDPAQDLLAFLLSAPGVVGSWINLQYYGSRVDPERLGAGNKTLHNVCASVGVLEGGMGDLRPGLAWQSVHDGCRPIHEPRRLTWCIRASREAVDQALRKAPSAAALAKHQWVHVVAWEGGKAYLRSLQDTWIPLESPAA